MRDNTSNIEVEVRVDEFGTKRWFIKGSDILPREGLPAIVYTDGSAEWLLNDQLSRRNGPAVELANGFTEWWIDGIRLSDEQVAKHVSKLKSEAKKLKAEKLSAMDEDDVFMIMALGVS
ncbi:hypothetical protein M3914_003144 [Vibrio metschnikovii]|nr:hypothetical protein [Vibrio metschnikovii]